VDIIFTKKDIDRNKEPMAQGRSVSFVHHFYTGLGMTEECWVSLLVRNDSGACEALEVGGCYDEQCGQTGVWHGWFPVCGGAYRFHRPPLRFGPRWWFVGLMWYRDFLGWASQANRWRGVIYTMPLFCCCCGLHSIACVFRS
jgi:hypothetical protein